MDLEVLVDDASDGSRRTFRFGRSPIRLGRSPLNDLPLPWPFVSHCHAVIQFDGAAIRYVDLGSTNGSHVEGTRLPHNTPVSVNHETAIRIGALTLRLHPTVDASPARMTYSDLEGETRADHAPQTSSVASREPDAEIMARIAVLYDAYRKSFEALFHAILSAGEGRHGAARDALAAAILTRCAELPQEAAFRRWLGTNTSSAGESVSGALARRLGLPRLESGDALAERLASLLLRFASAFVELRRGQEQFVASLGLGLVSDRAPLTTANDGFAVLSHLLDPEGDRARLDELNRAYAELMLHQLALVGASTAGARDVVAAFRPESLLPTRRGVWSFLDGLLRGAERSRALSRRVEDLSEERALTALLFGRSFARSYAVLLGRGGEQGSISTQLPARARASTSEDSR